MVGLKPPAPPQCTASCELSRGLRSSVALHRHTGDVLEVELSGDLDVDDAQLLDRWLRRELASCARGELFMDFERFRSYASPVRSLATRALLDHRGAWISLQTIGGSKLVRMGVSVANIALGGVIHQHADRDSFAAALARARAG